MDDLPFSSLDHTRSQCSRSLPQDIAVATQRDCAGRSHQSQLRIRWRSVEALQDAAEAGNHIKIVPRLM